MLLQHLLPVSYTHLLEQGIKAIALSSENSDNEREEAIRKLEQGEIEYIVSVDIFNEGVDIPCVNQVILLRPKMCIRDRYKLLLYHLFF